jgi:hypothetical protein
VPVWHDTIKKLKSDNLHVVAVVQEQHAERTRLYAQWNGYDWPIAQDPITKLGATAVPMFIGIDEFGIVRDTGMKPADLEAFVGQKFDPPSEPSPALPATPLDQRTEPPRDAPSLIEFGDDLLLWRRTKQSLDQAITAYSSALEDSSLSADQRGAVLFRIGVAHRLKYDELTDQGSDFDAASRFWSEALAANPNQYIWRRRIQQYGPRQDKPYPFYDWVETAQRAIRERGETPIELTVNLTESEIASPPLRGENSAPSPEAKTNPDPDNKIVQDPGKWIRLESTAVPSFVTAGGTTRVHLRWIPSAGKWNNEAEPLRVWIESEGNTLNPGYLLTFDNPHLPDSKETRPMEFEVQTSATASTYIVKGFALYNACDNSDATCRFLRQDFSIEVDVRNENEVQSGMP